MSPPINNRYEFVFLFDVKNGNPNGDPDNANAPRMDFETQRGWVSDVCLKRKIRNYINLVKADGEGKPEAGYDVYVKERSILNQTHQKAYDALGLKVGEKTKAQEKNDMADKARNWMCQTYFDIRMFGAVMTTGVNCGQVRGPVQIAFSTSIDPIVPQEQSLTRMAVTTEDESEKQAATARWAGKTLFPTDSTAATDSSVHPSPRKLGSRKKIWKCYSKVWKTCSTMIIPPLAAK